MEKGIPVCIVNPVKNQPPSQANMENQDNRTNGSPHEQFNLRSRVSPGSHNINNSNNASFPVQRDNDDEMGEVRKKKFVPPKPSRAPSVRNKNMSPGENNHTNFTNQITSVKNSVSMLSSNQNESHLTESRSVTSGTSVNMRAKPEERKAKSKDAVGRSKRASCFKPMQYQCTMLSAENPPLEQKALIELKKIFQTEDSFKLARHMTVIDCKVCQILENNFERIFLPHASQLRQDILERYQCIAFWVAICILKCSNGKEERAAMLNIFIKVANELVHSMGNVFGFSAVMHGLTCPQISSLKTSWVLLRERYTSNAVTFDKKLRPLLRFLDEGKGQISLSTTCIPHIMPMIRLLEDQKHEISHWSSGESIAKKSNSFGSLLDHISTTGSMDREDSLSLHSMDADKSDWWENHPHETFDSLLSHLVSGRSILQNAEGFKRNANLKLIDFKETKKLREMFTTDFQIRMLFGFRSAESPRRERFHKFDRIITAMLRHITD